MTYIIIHASTCAYAQTVRYFTVDFPKVPDKAKDKIMFDRIMALQQANST